MSNRTFFKWILVLTNVLLIAVAIAGISLSYLVVTPIVQRDTDADLGKLVFFCFLIFFYSLKLYFKLQKIIQ